MSLSLKVINEKRGGEGENGRGEGREDGQIAV